MQTRAGLGDREVGAADGHRRAQELAPQVGPGRRGQGAGLVGQSSVDARQLRMNSVADLGAVLVDRRDQDVRRPLAGELDDQLGQVGLDRLDARLASSASFRPISSVVSDLILTTSRAPCAAWRSG